MATLVNELLPFFPLSEKLVPVSTHEKTSPTIRIGRLPTYTLAVSVRNAPVESVAFMVNRYWAGWAVIPAVMIAVTESIVTPVGGERSDQLMGLTPPEDVKARDDAAVP
ncbi:unannotated protein [freshwater metagenome]|uniref:Unannotated protein n=1 Tax=freshwater metagenome TaxID=449393 RepID=A0A6J7KXS6_9ZZZZ